jgi:Dyp-type peroxidase family
MARLHKEARPIANTKLQPLQQDLENLQGNILHGHERNRAVHIFLQFQAEKSMEAKQWLRQLAEQITSAQQQLEVAEAHYDCKVPRKLFCSFFLSAKGYEALGIMPPDDQAFREGMKKRKVILHDPPDNAWEEGYQREIHAMLLLADDDEPYLLLEAQKRFVEMQTFATICAVEHGHVMRNAQGQPIEHFGYVDGRSQPLFFQKDVTKEQEERGGIDTWNPSAGPNLVLVEDPNVAPHVRELACGSYLVFRKLEQNVRGFEEYIMQLAALVGQDAERARALVMGRFRDGTPIMLQDAPGMHEPIPNDFDFRDDPEGKKCPFHAHIRRMNPRGDYARSKRQPSSYERRHRIVRRVMPYGTCEKEPQDNSSLEELPSEGVGLLFLCYQREISEQFEFLQKEWANNQNFLKRKLGLDAIAGQIGEGEEMEKQHWPAHGNCPQAFSFHGFVTLKGGEYFFTPSIPFLKAL